MKVKKKKVKKYRGSKTHGGGAMKKRRGAGNRGGRGRAGSGKRGDAKKPRYWKNKHENQARKGFKPGFLKKKPVRGINIGELHQKLDRLIEQGLITKKAGGYEANLKDLGYEKLLGTGRIKERFIITAEQASKKAVSKISDQGGKVILPEKKQEKKAKTKPETEKKQDTQGTQEQQEEQGEQAEQEQPEQEEQKA